MIKCMQISTPKLTPLRAIRLKCLDCSGHERNEVRNCQFEDCPLFSLRMGKGSRATLKKIRAFCLWCCIGQRDEIRLCPAIKCTLWKFRFGKRPLISIVTSQKSATAGVFDAEGQRV